MPKLIFPDATFDKCALCAESSALQISHIIPSFIFRWFKESSATGYLRFGEAPNLRVQDGLKIPMLCADCERLFSPWEKNFSEECFEPIMGGHATKLRYASWMLKFATSVSWRVLRIFSATNVLVDYPPNLLAAVNDALREWSEVLLGHRLHAGRHEQHMFLVDTIENTTVSNVPPNINRYLTRTIQCDIARSDDSAFTYAKMGKLILCGFINMSTPRRWKGTKLNASHGTFGIQDIELPSEILDYMFEQAASSGTAYTRISGRQKDKIRKSYETNPDRAARSESFRAMHHDVLLFGEKAFEFTQPSMEDNRRESDDENAK